MSEDKKYFYEGSDSEAEELNKQHQRIKQLEQELSEKMEGAVELVKKTLDTIEAKTNWYCYCGDYLRKEMAEINKTIYVARKEYQTMKKGAWR